MSGGPADLFCLQLIDPSLFKVYEAHYLLIFFYTLWISSAEKCRFCIIDHGKIDRRSEALWMSGLV